MMKLPNVLLACAVGAGSLLGAVAPASAARVVVRSARPATTVRVVRTRYTTVYRGYGYRYGYAYPYSYGYPFGVSIGVGYGVGPGYPYGVGAGFGYAPYPAVYVARPYWRPYHRVYRVRRFIR